MCRVIECNESPRGAYSCATARTCAFGSPFLIPPHACPPGGIAALVHSRTGTAPFCPRQDILSLARGQRVAIRAISVFLMREWQRQGDGGAPALSGFEPDATALPFHQLMAQEQTQTRSSNA